MIHVKYIYTTHIHSSYFVRIAIPILYAYDTAVPVATIMLQSLRDNHDGRYVASYVKADNKNFVSQVVGMNGYERIRDS